MTRCSSWPAFIQAAIHVSGGTVLDAADLVRNHVASGAVKAHGEEQSRKLGFGNLRVKAPGESKSPNDSPSAPRDPLVTELAKAESDLERIEAQRTATNARIDALRKELAALDVTP